MLNGRSQGAAVSRGFRIVQGGFRLQPEGAEAVF